MIISLALFVQTAFAGSEKHNFKDSSWAKGKSCLVCHDLKNNLPKVFPPDSRIVDLTKLTPAEQAAMDSNSNNISCLVCHQTQHSPITPKIKPTDGNLPPSNLPPEVSSGSQGSGNIRVVNKGLNSLDCLQCHDLHNKDSDKLLKADY